MNIGFDLDGIFINTPPFVPKKLIDWLYRGHDHNLFYRIPSRVEQFVRILTHYPILRPLMKKNRELMRDVAWDGNKYYLISSRFGFLKNRTEAIVAKYNFDKIFNGMYFNFNNEQPNIFKERVLRKLMIDRYVDDDLPLLRYLTSRNPKARFYWLNEKKSGALENNLFAITHLSAIIQ